MSSPAISAGRNATLEQLAALILKHGIGCIPIVGDDGRICGIVTESDFIGRQQCVPFSMFRAPQLFGRWFAPQDIERVYQAARRMMAEDIMTRPVATVDEDASMQEVMHIMLERDVNRIPVVRDGVPVGIVARRDILKIMLGQTKLTS
jgi:CBS domain-containing protein